MTKKFSAPHSAEKLLKRRETACQYAFRRWMREGSRMFCLKTDVSVSWRAIDFGFTIEIKTESR